MALSEAGVAIDGTTDPSLVVDIATHGGHGILSFDKWLERRGVPKLKRVPYEAWLDLSEGPPGEAGLDFSEGPPAVGWASDKCVDVKRWIWNGDSKTWLPVYEGYSDRESRLLPEPREDPPLREPREPSIFGPLYRRARDLVRELVPPLRKKRPTSGGVR